MIIFPAIDLFEGKAVRLYKGDYGKMTVYSENPPEIGKKYRKLGAKCIHIVDLEAAKDGVLHNFDTVVKIKEKSGLFCEIGGGVRSMETVEKYVSAGIDRVIIGTAAITDEKFLDEAAFRYGDKIAVGADLKDGFVAINGWLEKSEVNVYDFCEKLQKKGVKTVIVTDISKDGVNKGTNLKLYKELSEKYDLDFVASGGVSDIENVRELRRMNVYGAIIGRAYYDGLIDLREAIKVAK